MMKRIFIAVLATVLLAGSASVTSYAADRTNTEQSDNNLEPLPEMYKDIYKDGVYYIPEGTKEIKSCEFEGWGTDDGPSYWENRPLKFVIPSSVEKIGDYAFSVSNIEEIVIPGTVKEVGNAVFCACDNLKKVTIQDGVETIGRRLCDSCDNLETVIMPKAVKEWDTTSAFYADAKLKEITLPEEGVDSFGGEMFMSCLSLKEITIPDCVTTLNYGVFDNTKYDLHPEVVDDGVPLTIHAGYNVVKFEDDPEAIGNTGLCVVWRNSNVILDAPVDSAIVDYARDYEWIKYDYPKFERAEWNFSGEFQNNEDYFFTSVMETYMIPLDYKMYPENSQVKHGYKDSGCKLINKQDTTASHNWYYMDLEQHNFVNNESYANRKEGISLWKDYMSLPCSMCFSYTFNIPSDDLAFSDQYTSYFRLTMTEESYKEGKYQMEVLTAGNPEDDSAVWELCSPAIDTSSLTPVPTVTNTPIPTATPTATNTPTPTVTPMATNTPAPTAIPTATDTPTPTVTPMAMNTPAPTAIPTATNTPTPTVTPMTTNTPAPTATPMVTCSLTPTMELTDTPEPTVSPMPTVAATISSKPMVTRKPISTVTPKPTITRKPVKPAKVSLSVLRQKKTAVSIRWKKSGKADGYVIYRKVGHGSYKKIKTITNGKTTTYTNKGVKKGKTYYYKIKAYRNISGRKVYGSYSNGKKIKIK